MTSVAVIGASGYVGGELLRLLLGHPAVTSIQATSESQRGQPVDGVHRHLWGATDLQFVRRDELRTCDVVFLAMPHGSASAEVAAWEGIAPVTIDLSADFRLKDLDTYERYYGDRHAAPHLVQRFAAGIPEFNRTDLATASHIAGPGCTALAAILAINPVSRAGIIKTRVFVDAKVASSGAGARPALSTHHALRSGGTRIFKASGHRHEAEISAFCNVNAYATVTSVDAVRGVLVTAYCDLAQRVNDNDLRAIYRASYGSEPFARLVKRKGNGPHALPEPRLLLGTNICDVGFALTPDGESLVTFGALDNLTKGAAGNAVHCMNIRLGLEETAGLRILGTYPS